MKEWDDKFYILPRMALLLPFPKPRSVEQDECTPNACRWDVSFGLVIPRRRVGARHTASCRAAGDAVQLLSVSGILSLCAGLSYIHSSSFRAFEQWFQLGICQVSSHNGDVNTCKCGLHRIAGCWAGDEAL